MEELADGLVRAGQAQGTLAHQLHLLGDEVRRQSELISTLLAMLVDRDFGDTCFRRTIVDLDTLASSCPTCPLVDLTDQRH